MFVAFTNSIIPPPPLFKLAFRTCPPLPLLKRIFHCARMEASGGNRQAVADEATAAEVEFPVDKGEVRKGAAEVALRHRR